ncbi:MDR family MFS transporter [Streptomyces gobiensis]|uniref:MDR family MFS transporter n=1 Tax=Streptomyces gobiensis TaxID=2875706 RepID=UPI001E527316|nr:MDR family MFS transporter [Streptomyces gobiensis]UGY92995.1 MFS transporter [Streptomyces gobiensis]
MTDSASSPTGGSQSTANEPTHREIMIVMAGLMLGLFLGALDLMVVATAMRTIADELNGLTVQAWVTTAYLVTSTITTPLLGKLSDIYGRKRIYVISIVTFLIASLLCGIAQSMYELAAYRALQGIGAGGVMTMAFTIMGDMMTPQRRSRYQGYFSLVFGIAGIAGPLLGGLFADMGDVLGIAGWRWVFLINLPIGLLALIVVTTTFKMPRLRTEQRVDYGGAFALTLCLVPLLVVAEQGREWGWGSVLSLTMFALGLAGLILFILVESRMGDAAIIPMRLFRTRAFSVINAVNIIVGMGVFGSLLFLPLYLQLVKGLSPGNAALMLLPQTVGTILASRTLGPVINRTGRYKEFILLGLGLVTTALLLFGTVGPDTALWLVVLYTCVLGLGVGICFPVTLIALQNGARKEEMGVASAAYMFFREIGGTAGVAVFLSVMFSVVGGRIADALRVASGSTGFQAALRDPDVVHAPANTEVLEAVRGGGDLDIDNTAWLAEADPRLARPVLEGLAEAINTVYLTAGAVMLLGFLVALLLKGGGTAPKAEKKESTEPTAAP